MKIIYSPNENMIFYFTVNFYGKNRKTKRKVFNTRNG